MTDTPPPFSATIALLTVGRVWEAELTAALKPLGLTTRSYGLLGHIGAQPSSSFSELARRSRITVQSAHTAVGALVTAGLVHDTTAHAGSASTLRVTPAGEALLARARAEIATLDTRIAAEQPELSDALRAAVQRMLGPRPTT